MEDVEFFARMFGISPEEAAQHLGMSDEYARHQEQQTRNQMLQRISALAGGSSNPVTLEQLQQNPEFSAFIQQAQAAGFDPAELVSQRNQNISNYQTGGTASQVGDFFDRSGLGDLITYGTIAAAGAGAAGAFGAGGSGVGGTSSGTFAGGSSTLPAASGFGGTAAGAAPLTGGAIAPSGAALTGAAGAAGAAAGGASVPFWQSWGPAIVSGASSLLGADQQSDAAGEAAAVQERADLRARADLQPFRQAGGAVLNPLTDFVLQGPETELERTEGFRDIQTSAAAAGKLRSGGTLKALTSFNNMLNARNRTQRFNELFNVASLGSNAAARQATNTLGSAQVQGDLITQGGNARAAGIVGAGNAGTNALTNLLFLRQLSS